MSISTEIARLQQAKADLKTAIEAKGVTVPAATTLDGYAALVDQIQQGGGTLPYDAEVEYLQGDGASYIDTGIVDTGSYKIYANVSFAFPTTSAQYAFFYGSSNGWAKRARVVRAQQNNYIYIWYNNTEKLISSFTQIVLSIEDTPTSFNINGVALWNRSAASFSNSLSIFLFADNHNGSPNWGTSEQGKKSIKYYGFRIYNGNTLLINLIPVRVGTVGCMYDKISKTLFYNQGTGSFVLGADVT